MNALAAVDQDAHEIMERVVAAGDLAQLSPADRNAYYFAVCRSAGLNPVSRPFEYLRLSGKLVLYARRDAADQLRKVNGISLRVVSRETVGDLYVVTVEAKDSTGRVDSDIGAVAISGLRGEALANALLKATTKAKRRVTLSISGLGLLDETEVSDIPRRERQDWNEPGQAVPSLAHDPGTGELRQPEPAPAAAKRRTLPILNTQGVEIGEAASGGEWLRLFREWWAAGRTGLTHRDNLGIIGRIIAKMPDSPEREDAEGLAADLLEDIQAVEDGRRP